MILRKWIQDSKNVTAAIDPVEWRKAQLLRAVCLARDITAAFLRVPSTILTVDNVVVEEKDASPSSQHGGGGIASLSFSVSIVDSRPTSSLDESPAMVSADRKLGASADYNGGVSDERGGLASLSSVLDELIAGTFSFENRPGTGALASDKTHQKLGANTAASDERSSLTSLGTVFYEIFSGIPPFGDLWGGDSPTTNVCPAENLSAADESYRQPKKREKRTRNEQPYVSLRELGLPVSISSIVSELIDSGEHSDSYRSAAELEGDLCLMIAEPDRFLFDAETVGKNKLNFPSDKLYGRAKHVARLREACERAMGSSEACEVILVSGYSGTGKSSLVRQVRGCLTNLGGCFITGKFDGTRQAQPLSAIVAAFNQCCDVILQRDSECLDVLRSSIKDAIENDGKVLTDLIPNLSKVIGEPRDLSAKVRGKEAHYRLKYLFGMFVRAVSSPSHPIILFLDDLQWADEESLEILHFLVTDAYNSLVLLGCYRDNEVGQDHPLKVQLGEMVDSGVIITEIKVGNIDKNSMNELVSDTLHLLPRVTQPLTDAVYSKTNGNALFFTQFLTSLHEEGLLRFSPSMRRWEWDVDMIWSKKIADNVCGLMMDKMVRLDQEVQTALRVAACFGAKCEESVLNLLGGDNRNFSKDIIGNLDMAVEEGLMVKIGSSYHFSHDQIQHAAHSLTPESEKKTLHLQIGRQLWKRASKEKLEELLFVVVDQLNHGLNLIMEVQEKTEVAYLNLRAGEKAIASSSFFTASIYFSEGINALGETSWERNYDLSLHLYSCCVETHYVLGNFSEMHNMVHPIFAHGRCIDHKLCAYYTVVKSLGAQNLAPDSISTGLGVLFMLGESFPEVNGQHLIRRELVNTRDLLEGTTIEGILRKDEMRDKQKVAAMQFLDVISLYAFVARQELFSLVAFRMVQLTLSHGICRESAYGFATFGMILCGSDDVRAGYRFGKVALSLLERSKARECLPQVYTLVYAFINFLVEPMQATLEAFLFAHKVGTSTGNIHWAMANINLHTMISFQCGCNLEQMAERVGAFVDEMKHFKQDMALLIIFPYYQAICNLICTSGDPTKLTGKVMDQDKMLKTALERNQLNAVMQLFLVRMKLSYLFRKYELAAEMAEKHRDILSRISGQCLRNTVIVDETFYKGLLAITLVRTKQQLGWRPLAKDALQKLKDWARSSHWNFQHKHELLHAEWAFLNGDIENAAKAYDRSIYFAGKHGFIHEQALACERAAIFSSGIGNNITASEYYSRSRELYLQWGARTKADDIKEQIVSNKCT